MTVLRPVVSIAVAFVLPTLGVSHAAWAQKDLSGMWGQRFHEELPERGAGPEIGDYAGLPVNDAARLRADSWVAVSFSRRICVMTGGAGEEVIRVALMKN